MYFLIYSSLVGQHGEIILILDESEYLAKSN